MEPRAAVPEAPGKRRSRARSLLIDLAETVLLTVLLFLGIQTFVAQPYKIEQHSMETTLLPEQYVLVDKLTPRWAPYARGDIVVVHRPDLRVGEPDVPIIKRVIGLPHDRVELVDGGVVVNGVTLDEPYLFQEDGVAQPTEQTGAESAWDVPAGTLFLMGDHRFVSEDSRVFGPVAIDAVIGRAWLRYWPPDVFGPLPQPSGGV